MTIQKATNLLSLLAVSWAMLTLSCTGRAVGNGGGTDGNTHWLGYCTNDDDCETGLSCLCQTCTKPCDETAACSDLDAQAACLEVAASCGTSAPERTCSASCDTADDCPGSDLDCEDGRCVAPPPMECDAPDDCEASGMACEAGRCVAASGTCAGIENCIEPGTVVLPGDDCEAMDARPTGNMCGSIAGYTWDGEGCLAIGCSCTGTECGFIYEDRESCYAAHSACDVRCPKLANECPEGCGVIRGTPYYSDRECRDASIVLGCDGSGRVVTQISECVQSPDGVIVHVTQAQQLIDYGGYTRCTDEMSSTARSAPGCGECAAMDARTTGNECGGIAGYTWDGEGCIGIVCSCMGEDCDSIFEDRESCLAAHSSCSALCPKIADTCPDGCSAIGGIPYYPDRECRLSGAITLGCSAGDEATADANCLQSPDGIIVDGVSGTYVQQLRDYGGYEYCNDEGQDALSDAPVCPVGDPSLEGRRFTKETEEGVPPEVTAAEIGVQFQDGQFTFSTDCNGGTGAYSVCDGNLCVDGFSSTTRGCDSTVDDWLTTFFTAEPMLILDGGNLTFASDTASLGFVETQPLPAN